LQILSDLHLVFSNLKQLTLPKNLKESKNANQCRNLIEYAVRIRKIKNDDVFVVFSDEGLLLKNLKMMFQKILLYIERVSREAFSTYYICGTEYQLPKFQVGNEGQKQVPQNLLNIMRAKLLKLLGLKQIDNPKMDLALRKEIYDLENSEMIAKHQAYAAGGLDGVRLSQEQIDVLIDEADFPPSYAYLVYDPSGVLQENANIELQQIKKFVDFVFENLNQAMKQLKS
jgi:hypothetical protein